MIGWPLAAVHLAGWASFSERHAFHSCCNELPAKAMGAGIARSAGADWLRRRHGKPTAILCCPRLCAANLEVQDSNRSPVRAPSHCELRRGQGCRPSPLYPFLRSRGILSPLRSDQFLLTKANTSCTIELPASLRSHGVRVHPGMLLGNNCGMSVQLHRNPHGGPQRPLRWRFRGLFRLNWFPWCYHLPHEPAFRLQRICGYEFEFGAGEIGSGANCTATMGLFC